MSDNPSLPSPSPSVLCESPEHIDFHIKNGDYFAFLATLMGFMQEGFEKSCEPAETCREHALTKELRADLRYVHQRYRIVPKEEPN